MIAGFCLAWLAYVIFLRSYPREQVSESDRRLAPVLALGTIGIVGLGVSGFWVAYQLGRRLVI